MISVIVLLVLDAILINAGFVLAFLIRYGLHIPPQNFTPYKNTFIFLTLINLTMLAFFGVYRKRFRSSWDLFHRVFIGLFWGLLLNIVFVYIFRIQCGKFPTSVFGISFCINFLLIFKFNQFILKSCGKIKKRVIIIGDGDIDEIAIKKASVERYSITAIQDIAGYSNIDEIIICGKIPNEKDMSLLTYLAQKMNIAIVFSPACYVRLLSEKINGNGSIHFLATFVGKKRDVEEFLMRSLDIVGSFVILLFSLPLIVVTAILIKLTTKGPVFYKQERVGKDGKVFTLYKFRTMIPDAEKHSGPVWASPNDPRVTRVGRLMRDTRLDEFPQLINVLVGQMSLVGPRPERPYFVKRHKVLMDIRLAVRPGLTGLAQIRNAYDLHPRHKIKYDYLYIQRRSSLLNLYILIQTIPIMLLKKGT